MEPRHETVLLEEAVQGLAVAPGDTVVDCTLGGAGHFGALLSKLSGQGTLVGIDADADALRRAQAVSKGTSTTVHLVEANFRTLDTILDRLGIDTIDGALFDLGWSAFHLSRGRGFSFKTDEPLLMTYGNPEAGKTAADFINSATEEEISDVLHTYGEERFARQIARNIVNARTSSRILTTLELAEVVAEATPAWYRARRMHPATKTFQALRIAVNDELGALRDGLSAALARLSEGGRVAVITFHSIEDRIVKSALRDAAYEGNGCVLTKKPIVPSDAEIARNPRARSAKLRIFERGECPVRTLKPFTTLAYA